MSDQKKRQVPVASLKEATGRSLSGILQAHKSERDGFGSVKGEAGIGKWTEGSSPGRTTRKNGRKMWLNKTVRKMPLLVFNAVICGRILAENGERQGAGRIERLTQKIV